jgi:hypothetical protein
MIAACVMMATFGTGAALATASPAGQVAAAHPTTYSGASAGAGGIVASAPVAAIPAAACNPFVDGDNVHVSSGDVSGHGWWYQGSCGNVKTTVYIYLYEYYSDGSWREKNSGSKNVYPGGGSANRAATRIVCTGVIPAAWRTLVVVHIGNGASAYTKTLNLPCRNG